MADQTQTPKHIKTPTWLNAVVFVGSIVLGAWLFWRYVLSPDPVPEIPVVQADSNDRGPQRRAMVVQPGRTGDMLSKRGNRINASRGFTILRADANQQNQLNIDFSYARQFRQQWVDENQLNLLELARSIAFTPNLAKHVNLTDEQRNQLRAILVPSYLTADDKNRLAELCKAWDVAQGADKIAAQERLLSVMEQLGQSRLAQAQAAERSAAGQIPTILTEQQINSAREYLGNRRRN